jgi:hypothetical protein
MRNPAKPHSNPCAAFRPTGASTSGPLENHRPGYHGRVADPTRTLFATVADNSMDAGTRERHLLRALCQTSDSALRRRALEVLPLHRWTHRDHQLIFETWALLARTGTRVTRETLAAQLTRAGFPEMDFDALFAPLHSPAADLARRLDEIGGSKPSGPTGAEGKR